MTRSLAERLQEKLSDQTAEIAAMTDSELKKLSEHVTQSVAAELNGIEIVIARSVNGMTDDLPRLKWIVGATWAALIVSLCLVIFSAWLSIQPRPVQVMPSGVRSFQSDGRTYLTVPEGIEPKTCLDGRQEILCLLLPENGNGS